jgi:hypothetical protein
MRDRKYLDDPAVLAKQYSPQKSPGLPPHLIRRYRLNAAFIKLPRPPLRLCQPSLLDLLLGGRIKAQQEFLSKFRTLLR